MTTDTAERTALIESLGLKMDVAFVPFSQSRNKREKQKSLNWLVALSKGNQSMTIEYMQGIGHVPGYPQIWGRTTYEQRQAREAAEKTCETGQTYRIAPSGFHVGHKKIETPKLEDILHCLTIDCNVLNYGTYEEWASEFGYDEDSRKGEATYRACLNQTLQLRAMIGNEAIEQLQAAFQDY